MTDVAFKAFPKTTRTPPHMVLTEKIDGTNTHIIVPPDESAILVGSRNRWITPGKTTDNYGFAAWVAENETLLRRLGPGRHDGEWWGQGIARHYDLDERRWSLFNARRYTEEELRARELPQNVHPVPVLYTGKVLGAEQLQQFCADVQASGSVCAPGFQRIEGIVAYVGDYKWKIVFDKDGRSPEEKPCYGKYIDFQGANRDCFINEGCGFPGCPSLST